MAAATTTTLHIINAATHKELMCVKKAGSYIVDGEVVLGDLYKDPEDDHIALIAVTSRIHPENIDNLLPAKSSNGAGQSATS